MKRIFMSLTLLFVVALTATATGYASEADTGYHPPTVIQIVQADMPAVQEYAFLGLDAGMAVTYANRQVCPDIVLQPVAGECPNDLFENEQDTLYYGDVMSALVRAGGSYARYDKKGVCIIYQVKT